MPKKKQSYRDGHVLAAGYLPPETQKRMKIMVREQHTTVEALIAEALNLLFAKYRGGKNVPSGNEVGLKTVGHALELDDELRKGETPSARELTKVLRDVCNHLISLDNRLRRIERKLKEDEEYFVVQGRKEVA